MCCVIILLVCCLWLFAGLVRMFCALLLVCFFVFSDGFVFRLFVCICSLFVLFRFLACFVLFSRVSLLMAALVVSILRGFDSSAITCQLFVELRCCCFLSSLK